MCQARQHMNSQDDIVVFFGQMAIRGLKTWMASALTSEQIGHVNMKRSTSGYFTLTQTYKSIHTTLHTDTRRLWKSKMQQGLGGNLVAENSDLNGNKFSDVDLPDMDCSGGN